MSEKIREQMSEDSFRILSKMHEREIEDLKKVVFSEELKEKVDEAIWVRSITPKRELMGFYEQIRKMGSKYDINVEYVLKGLFHFYCLIRTRLINGEYEINE